MTGSFTWNYRLVRYVENGETVIVLAEVHYVDGETQWEPVTSAYMGETIEEAREENRLRSLAFDAPILDGNKPKPDECLGTIAWGDHDHPLVKAGIVTR